MRPLHLPIVVATIALTSAANAATIGVVAPHNGPYSILGAQVLRGAKAALQDSGHQIVEINESCENGSSTAIAEELVNSKASIAIGFLCTESLQGGIEFLAASNIPMLSLSSRASGLIEDAQKYNWPFYRMAPALSDEAQGATVAIISHWKGMPIALIDDGTIYSRELTDNIRLQLENLGLKPSFVDTLRPGQENQVALVRRLARLNINHAFVAADRNDVAIIGRDANANGAKLTLMSGEAMKAANIPVPTTSGTLAVIEPDSRDQPLAKAVVDRLEADGGAVVEGYVLPAYAAAQLAKSALDASQNEKKPLNELLSTRSFETILGPIRFNEQKGLSSNPFKLQQWNGAAFVDPTTP